MCCPLTGAYIPSLIACTVVGAAFIFGFESYVHGKLLMATYLETPDLWRKEEDMQTHFNFMIAMQVATAFITAAIYSVGHEGKGCCEGVRYGLLLGALFAVMGALPYVWMPISLALAKAWALTGLAKGLGLGVIYSLVYKTKCCSKSACGTGEKKEGGCCDTKGSCGTGS